MNTTPDAHDARRLLRTMTRVLCAVGILALIFTTTNVTLFATSRGVPGPIAILLDPMLASALTVVLLADSRLASWGIRPPTWSAALRWSAGCTAALMNSWASLWPDRQIGWPRHADPAAVLLHLTPALLLILLTETIAAYRRTIGALLEQIHATDPGPETDRPPTDHTRSTPPHTTPTATRHSPGAVTPVTSIPSLAGWRDAPSAVDPRTPVPTAAVNGADTPPRPSYAPTFPPAADDPADGDLWARAVALDNAARAARGRPASVWRLRTDLRIGPERAAQIRARLLQRNPDEPKPLS
ncbi:extensin [Streptomyces sp. NPDC102360]|uniref:extensin n=1 Tax=Streptomyces sp. NPDC102360 TaxID=3366160 RepID=UPI003828D78F